MQKLRLEVQKAIESATGKTVSLQELSTPPDPKMGDLASRIAFQLPGNPKENAEALAKKAKPSGLIREVKAFGPYLNFYADWNAYSESAVKSALSSDYGKSSQTEKILVEYSQPNTHKAFHVGHLRNVALGDALSRILKWHGFETVQLNYINDMGAHVAKTLWCYEKLHKSDTPPENRGKWLGEIYAEAASLEKESESNKSGIAAVLQRLEAGDPKTMALWQETRQWSLDEFNRIYEELGANFDLWYYESDIKQDAKKIVKELLDKGIAKVDQGAVIVDNSPKGINIIQRTDGTALYSTSDLALAKKKFIDHSPDRNVYVVASEQKFHFEMLFETLKKWGFKNAEKCFHLSYELVMLKGGKMKSREGKVVLYEDFAREAFRLALEAVEEKNPSLPSEEKREIARSVAIGAMKYGMLRVSNNKTITFDWDTALDFNGDTAPYIQYAHARARRILEKSGKKPKPGALTNESELILIRQLAAFPEAVEEAAAHYSPHAVASYAYQLADKFSTFYSKEQVIGAKNEEALLALVAATANTLKISLSLLGIDAPDRM